MDALEEWVVAVFQADLAAGREPDHPAGFDLSSLANFEAISTGLKRRLSLDAGT